jgi:hypothetical protein
LTTTVESIAPCADGPLGQEKGHRVGVLFR